MARMKINDLHKDMKTSKEEMKNVVGGAMDTFLQIDGIPSVSIGGGGGGIPTELKGNVELVGAIGFSHGLSGH